MFLKNPYIWTDPLPKPANMLKEFLSPVNAASASLGTKQVGRQATVYSKVFPKIERADIALVGINEERGCTNNHGTANAPSAVRRCLYQLYDWRQPVKLLDLGDINTGRSIEDTYAAVTTVCEALLDKDVLPIFIGGSHDLAYAQFLGYKNFGNAINLVDVDERLNLSGHETKIDAGTFLSAILDHHPELLLSFNQLGYQNYLTNNEQIRKLVNLNCEFHRLGRIRQDVREIEPIVRDADMLSFDMAALRHADSPGTAQPTPNGFYAEEACQIMRYAGLSDRLSSLGVYEMNPDFDVRDQSAQLAAQMIWCFIEGYVDRKHDDPGKMQKDFIRYTVNLKEHDRELVFLQSKKSDRWWVEVPFEEEEGHRQIIPCSYHDYQLACQEEVPERWLKAFQRLN